MSTQEIIDALCKSRGDRKSKIEDELKLGSGYLSRVKNPSLDKLQKIADYFGVSADYLTTGKEPEFDKWSSENAMILENLRADEEMNKAILKYFKLSGEKKKHVIELINLLDKKL